MLAQVGGRVGGRLRRGRMMRRRHQKRLMQEKLFLNIENLSFPRAHKFVFCPQIIPLEEKMLAVTIFYIDG